MIVVDVRMTYILGTTIVVIEIVDDSHKGHAPQQAPSKGHNQTNQSQNGNIRGTPHCRQCSVQIRSRKGDSVPRIHRVAKCRQEGCKSHDGNDTIRIRCQTDNTPRQCHQNAENQHDQNQRSRQDEHEPETYV